MGIDIDCVVELQETLPLMTKLRFGRS